jgi:hypothetical protein
MRRRRPLLLVVLGLVVVAIACDRLAGCEDAPVDGAAPVSPPVGEDPVSAPAPASDPVPVVEGELGDRGGGIDPAAVPEALAAAEGFARAWSDPGARRRAVARLATPELAAALTEPVPHAPTGAPYLLLDAPEWVRVGVPAEGGTIVLDLVRVRGQWLVSALAWRGEAT